MFHNLPQATNLVLRNPRTHTHRHTHTHTPASTPERPPTTKGLVEPDIAAATLVRSLPIATKSLQEISFREPPWTMHIAAPSPKAAFESFRSCLTPPEVAALVGLSQSLIAFFRALEPRAWEAAGTCQVEEAFILKVGASKESPRPADSIF